MKKTEIKKEDQVTLKPILGIPPTTYVPVFYVLVIIIAAFLLFMLPGLLHNGSYLTVDTGIENSAVYADGVYIGESGVPHFVPKGTYTLTVRKPFFADATITDAKIPGNILFSLFYRKQVDFSTTLDIEDIKGYLSWRMSQVEQWAPVKQFSETYFLPQIFTETAEDLVFAGQAEDEEVYAFFTYAIGYMNSEEMIEDYTNGLSQLPPTMKDRIIASESYTRFLVGDTGRESIQADGDYRTLTIDDQIYLSVSSDENGTFYMASTETTESLYARFVSERPEWDAENINDLIAEDLVDEMYLDDVDLADPSLRPIRNVSYRAVKAFVEWYQNKLSQDGYEVELSLPTDEQWKAAAVAYGAENSYSKQILIIQTQAKELFGFFGSLWEMTDTRYLFNPTYIDDETEELSDTLLNLPDGLMTVKGGSYNSDDISLETRGVIDADACSPFIGFRLIVREQ